MAQNTHIAAANDDNGFADLGLDIIVHIGSFLSFDSFQTLSKTCHQVNQVTGDYCGSRYDRVSSELVRIVKLKSSVKADLTALRILQRSKFNWEDLPII